MMEDERLKWVSLAVAFVVVLVAVYRWLLIRWRSDVSLRKYAFVRSMDREQNESPVMLEVEIPEPQHVSIELLTMRGSETETIFSGDADHGLLRIEIPMNGRREGTYEVVTTTQDQRDIKRFEWMC